MKSSETVSNTHYLVTYEVRQYGVRLDLFLKEHYRKRSREQLKKVIESGAITIQRMQSPHLTVGKLKPSLELIPGDEVFVMTERREEPAVCFDYSINYEDEVLFIINKPANLPVHPAGRYFFNTLLTHLKTQGHKTPLKADVQWYLAHRIDKETSGVLCLCKDKDASISLSAQFADRSTEKTYLAITKGHTEDEFTVDIPMKRSDSSQIALKMMVTTLADGGVSSITHFKRLERYEHPVHGPFSLVECRPRTGRQHQIRLHLDTAGFPIVGDKLYGMPEEEALRFFERLRLTPEAEAKLILPRHALHAAEIKFVHPVSKKPMHFKSPLPGDLMAFLDEMKKLD
jgi:23S rRNA pseudouridine1911/1915/1917 synthase